MKDIECCNRDMKKTFIVDNSPQAFGFYVENGVPIKSWYGDPMDNELIKLMKVLEDLKSQEDVRKYINNTFKIKEKMNKMR